MKKIIAAAVAASTLVSTAVLAAYPDRPIKMIVPWAAGGDTDNLFRPFAAPLQKALGQTVVIANIGGASGTKGAKEAKESPADGYTLYAVHDYIHSTYYTGVADVPSGTDDTGSGMPIDVAEDTGGGGNGEKKSDSGCSTGGSSSRAASASMPPATSTSAIPRTTASRNSTAALRCFGKRSRSLR